MDENSKIVVNIDDPVKSKQFDDVPIQFTKDVIKEISSNLKEGSLLCDVTSVKEEPLEAMSEYLPKNVEFIPTHPIFGPRTRELDNQVIVLTPQEKGNWYPKVFNYLESKNMRVIETTAEHHDYMMSIVQVLTHFAYISTASAFEKLKVSGDEKTGVEIVKRSIEEPVRQIANNCGLEGAVIVEDIRNGKKGVGFDALKEQYVDMIAAGIVDPTKVTRSALQNAASIAAMVLTTESLVADLPQKETPMPGGAPGGMPMM